MSEKITAIEALVKRADEAQSGYHISATFPDGSRINAPIVQVGPDWAEFGELGDESVFVNLRDATLEIDFLPGSAEAVGPRFENLISATAPRR